MKDYKGKNLEQKKSRVDILIEQFNASVALPFEKILPASKIEEMLDSEGIKYYNRIYSPIVTLWMFLSQVIDPDKSCHKAVSRVIAWLASVEEQKPSTDTSGYCQARKRLPENFLKKLFRTVAKQLEKEPTSSRLWCGRNVFVFDGTSVSMPDTKANQKSYRRPSKQKAGCGFPLAKLGVLFSLNLKAIAVIIEVFKTHDVKLARKLYENLSPGDVFLSDRACCSYADIYFLQQRQCDAVIRRPNSRKQPRRKGKRIGSNDYIVTWSKPKSKPKGISSSEYKSLPKTLKVREVHYYICIPGWRSKEVTIITTLLDSEIYGTLDLVRLYEKRWEVEIDIRHIKTSLKMDILRGKTPEMVRKEIYVHLLAYNLLRTLMWQGGTEQQVNPLEISLLQTRNYFLNFIGELKNKKGHKRRLVYQELLEFIGNQTLFK